MSVRGNFTQIRDIGRVRNSNDDSVLSTINGHGDVLLCVCDGMGGYKRGNFASKYIVDNLKDEFINCRKFYFNFEITAWINKKLVKINRDIFNYSRENEFKDMGSTIALVLLHNDTIFVGYAGDSRVYFYTKNKHIQVSSDDTYTQYLYKKGKINKEQSEVSSDRHTLTNAIGIFPTHNITIKKYKNYGTNILLCTDGLYNNLSEEDIFSILNTNESINDKATTLIACANSNGGSDNMGIVIWESIND